MKIKKSVYIILLCGLVILTGCGKKAVNAEESKIGTAVEAKIVSSSDICVENRVNGRVVAENEVAIYPPITAEVKSVNVKVGDKVTKSTLLFSLDNDSLLRNYNALADEYDRTKELLDKQIELAEKSLEDTKTIYNEKLRQAEVNCDNVHALYEVDAVTKLELDNADFALKQAEIGAETAIKQSEIALTSTKNSAESTLTKLENGVKDAKDVLDKTYGKSTINGKVTAVNIKEGGMATPQMACVVVSNGSKKQVLVSVSETLQPYLSAGDEVDVVVSSTNESIKGKIDFVSPSADPMTSLYNVNINVLDEKVPMTLGMFAEVIFKTNNKENVINIPTQSILTDGKTEYVFVTRDDVTVEKVNIETGIVGVYNTEVISGLNLGDKIITKGQTYLSDASSIRIVGEE